MITNLIWDVDGTLFDTYPAIVQAFLQALQSFGKSASAEDVDALAKVGLSYCATVLAKRFRLEKEELEERFGDLYSAIPKAAQPPFAGVKAVCQAIVDQGGINAIVTHRGRESTETLLTVHGMRHLFVEIVAGDAGYPKKPSPAAFRAIIDKLNLDRSQTAAIGDRDIDIEAGKAAGVMTCWFRGHPSQIEPDFVFSDYSESPPPSRT